MRSERKFLLKNTSFWNILLGGYAKSPNILDGMEVYIKM